MKLDRPKRGITHDTEDFQALLSRCPRTGKQRHASRAKAKQHAKHLKRAGKGQMDVYCCPHCNSGWHVTTVQSSGPNPRRVGDGLGAGRGL